MATERLTALPDGRLLYRLKRPWRDGTSAVIFERQDFIAKQIERPAYNLTVFKIHFGKLTLKIYDKGDRVLRVEMWRTT